MLVLALSKEGQEYIYDAKTARKVPKASAKKICEIVNEHKFLFGPHPGCVWHLHEIDQYDRAYYYAQYQMFSIRNGIVTAKNI